MTEVLEMNNDKQKDYENEAERFFIKGNIRYFYGLLCNLKNDALECLALETVSKMTELAQKLETNDETTNFLINVENKNSKDQESCQIMTNSKVAFMKDFLSEMYDKLEGNRNYFEQAYQQDVFNILGSFQDPILALINSMYMASFGMHAQFPDLEIRKQLEIFQLIFAMIADVAPFLYNKFNNKIILKYAISLKFPFEFENNDTPVIYYFINRRV